MGGKSSGSARLVAQITGTQAAIPQKGQAALVQKTAGTADRGNGQR